jgi:beta-phosphoglucomutase-like phosphatase (HAD superfamily)
VTVAVIFDVDGVLVDSPHERAWREAFDSLVEGEWAEAVAPGRPHVLDSRLYQHEVAGKPRLEGARAVLHHFGIADAGGRVVRYAEEKQRRLEALIDGDDCRAFPDAIRMVTRLRRERVPLAAASSSRNAVRLLRAVPMPAEEAHTLLDCFKVNVCGHPVAYGKPAPDLFLLAAAQLGMPPADCIVVEDAPAGIAAAREGGMKAIGIARAGDAASLQDAGADLVVGSLDEVDVDGLAAGRVASRPADPAGLP